MKGMIDVIQNNDLLTFDSNGFTNIYLYAITSRKELKLPVFVFPEHPEYASAIPYNDELINFADCSK